LTMLALQKVHEAGWLVGNVDCTVVAQAPKLAPFKAAMAQHIARVLQINEQRVNVKAKTAEKMGPVGEGKSIEAQAVVLLFKP
jgi:2-C-methyl-D-erythritol 2,4-cyclodiphosphate synthase